VIQVSIRDSARGSAESQQRSNDARWRSAFIGIQMSVQGEGGT
jgi:hypothetical protein